ncbi:hypothetical protein RCH09_002930 [Actimicrobium sp. GrIS 1.19]|uniref:hypothetical protein n=1 Tax=Actimicrobium sp. GrIS 1.19 TaxID=3071708 RepID=UPI002E016821|nr:hypothetical protein [Actimicrobium sp. GrIS 1.19]
MAMDVICEQIFGINRCWQNRLLTTDLQPLFHLHQKKYAPQIDQSRIGKQFKSILAKKYRKKKPLGLPGGLTCKLLLIVKL